MRKSLKFLATSSVIVAGLAFAPALFADDSPGSMMSPGMMGQGGMMNMMGRMGEMMESCEKMMQSDMNGDGAAHPNDQWREDAPVMPDQNG